MAVVFVVRISVFIFITAICITNIFRFNDDLTVDKICNVVVSITIKKIVATLQADSQFRTLKYADVALAVVAHFIAQTFSHIIALPS
jgi:hypothetical protein